MQSWGLVDNNWTECLSWDAFHCHLNTVKEELWISRVHDVAIPGGCTKYIQAPDVSWNKLSRRVPESGILEFTTHGNTRGPPRERLVDWILAAWNKYA